MGHVGLDTVGRPDMPNKHAFLEQSDAARTLAYIRFLCLPTKGPQNGGILRRISGQAGHVRVRTERAVRCPMPDGHGHTLYRVSGRPAHLSASGCPAPLGGLVFEK